MKKLENISSMVTGYRYFSALFHKMREGLQAVNRRMLVGKAFGKRPFARSRLCEDRVKLAPRETGFENMNWIKLI
jgi:hypothetical protein